MLYEHGNVNVEEISNMHELEDHQYLSESDDSFESSLSAVCPTNAVLLSTKSTQLGSIRSFYTDTDMDISGRPGILYCRQNRKWVKV